MANSYATMKIELRQRSVKILKSSKSPYEVVGTGILLDAAHILTCYHVVLSALRNEEKNLKGDKEKIIKGSSVYFLGFSNIASKPQNTVVLELGDFQDENFSDYSNDLAILKIANPLNILLPPLNWVQHELNAEFRMFSYRSKKNEKNPIGEELHGIAGEGVSRRACESWIRGASLANVDNKKPLAGASGSAMFAANANPNNLSCYGILIASEGSAYSSKDGTEVNEQKALFIAAREVKPFLVKANLQFPDTEKVISSKGQSPKDNRSSTLPEEPVDLALAMVDRHFLENVETRLANEGLVCLVVYANGNDWSPAICVRLTERFQMNELTSKGGGVLYSQLIDWSDNNQGKLHFTEMLQSTLNRIIKRSLTHNTQSINIRGADEKKVQAGFEVFHQAIEGQSRVVIFIKLPGRELYTNEQEALVTLVKQLQRYYRKMANASISERSPEVLLYLVAEPQDKSDIKRFLSNVFRRWLTKKKNKSLLALIEEIKKENKEKMESDYDCFYVQSEPLAPIVDTDIDKWFDTLSDDLNLNWEICHHLRAKASNLLNSQPEIRHQYFRDKMQPEFSDLLTNNKKVHIHE